MLQAVAPAVAQSSAARLAEEPPIEVYEDIATPSASVTRLHPTSAEPTRQSAVTPATPSEPVEETVPATAVPEAASYLPAQDALNWSKLAFELKLGGIAREFAINSIVKSWADNHLHLVFLPELDVMLKPQLVAQIKQAIEQQLGVELTLELNSQPALEVETPQQACQRKLEQQRQQAIRDIRQDEMVQQLQAAFGVELVEDSVKKIQKS